MFSENTISDLLILVHLLLTLFLICSLYESFPDLHNSYSPSNLSMYAQLQDLTHLSGPLTEDAILKTLQARFYGGHMYVSKMILNNP